MQMLAGDMVVTMRKTIVFLALSVLVLGAIPSTAVADDTASDDSRLFMTPDGLYWTDDYQVTRNSASDTLPQITVDRAHDAHIFWQRDGWYYKKFDRHGNALTKEKQVNSNTMGMTFLSEKVVDIDSNGNIHFIWVPGGYNGDVHYMKYDNSGNVLINDMIAVQDVSTTHVPNMAVSSDDAVNIIYEDYRYQCEDINYNKLVNGKIVKDAIAISSDVASHCEFCNIATDKYNTVYANFGSNTGSWIGAINSEGVHPWPSQKLPITSSYMTAGMACSPDTYVHIAYYESGTLYYQRYNQRNIAVTEPIVIDTGNMGDHQEWGDNRNPGIAADSSNNVIITYTKDDFVYYKYIKHNTWNETKAGGYKLVTKNTCRRSRVAVDPDDNVHFVWEDTRTGNKEIYYKFAYNFQLKLQADPVDLQKMFYFHPNETKELPFLLVNTGGIADKYDILINTAEIPENWVVTLNNTYCELAGNQKAYFKLTETSPQNAKEGEKIFVNITAKSRGNPEKNDRLNYISFIIVTHDVSLTCRNTVNIVYPGKSVSYNLYVTNIGDVKERIKVFGIMAAPDGWSFTIESSMLDPGGMVALDPKKGTNLTVIVTSPEDAKANDNATLTIQAYDMEKPEASSNIVLRTLVTPIFYLLWESDITEKWIDPGGTDNFLLRLTNYGNVVGTAQIHVEIQSDLRGWNAQLDKEAVQLRGGESAYVKLTVTVPAGALAGQRLVIRVVAETFTMTQKAYIETTSFVNIVHDIQPVVETGTVEVFPGQTAEYVMQVDNKGNGEDKVDLGVERAPAGWVIVFEYTNLPVDRVIVGPKNSKTVVVKVKTPYEAEAGVFPIDVVLRDSGGNDKKVTVTTKVTQIFDIDLKCSQVHQIGTPNGFITYPMVVENRGNGHDTISLEVTNLPDGWSHNFKDAAGTQITSVDLEYGSKVDIKLNIWVSASQMETAEQVMARAQSVFDPSKQDQIQLTAEIRMPDLKIQSVVYNPSNLRENKVVQIVVLLQNVGTGGASDIVVEFYDNGRYVSQDSISYITTGETGNATAVFTWLPKGGSHTLKYFVDPTSGSRPNGRVLESDETNNVLEMKKSVSKSEGLPGAGASLAMLAMLGAVFVAAGFRRRR
jgi:uncharacterized membrane protein